MRGLTASVNLAIGTPDGVNLNSGLSVRLPTTVIAVALSIDQTLLSLSRRRCACRQPRRLAVVVVLVEGHHPLLLHRVERISLERGPQPLHHLVVDQRPVSLSGHVRVRSCEERTANVGSGGVH